MLRKVLLRLLMMWCKGSLLSSNFFDVPVFDVGSEGVKSNYR